MYVLSLEWTTLNQYCTESLQVFTFHPHMDEREGNCLFFFFFFKIYNTGYFSCDMYLSVNISSRVKAANHVDIKSCLFVYCEEFIVMAYSTLSLLIKC